MAKLPGTVYLKDPDKQTDILTFGKSREDYDNDAKNGISRFGGFSRQPSYSQAYLKSAKIVLNKAIDDGELDELGLPVFYLIRHALELKLKGILEMAYDVLDMSLECHPTRFTIEMLPSKEQKDRLKSKHDLDCLFTDLKKSCKFLEVNVPEKEFSDVINFIAKYETNDTWSRYSKSKSGCHVRNEVILPIVQLAQYLERLFEKIAYEQADDSDSLESELYSKFSLLTSIIEEKRS